MGNLPVVQTSAPESRLLLGQSPACVSSNTILPRNIASSIRIAIAFLIFFFSPFSAYSQKSSGHHKSNYSTSAKRDSHGKIKRSESAKKKFMRQTGYPHGRPGYVIDHRVPLANGGRDDPSNMQWQTKADAKAKDKWERGQSTNSSIGKSHSRSHRSSGSKRSSPHYSRSHR